MIDRDKIPLYEIVDDSAREKHHLSIRSKTRNPQSPSFFVGPPGAGYRDNETSMHNTRDRQPNAVKGRDTRQP